MSTSVLRSSASLAALAALIAATLAVADPARPVLAQTATPAAACADAPAVAPQLDFPRSGAVGVATQPHRIDAQLFVTGGAPQVRDLRVVLSDGSPYLTEAGVLDLDPSAPDQLAPPMTLSPQAAASGTTRYVTTWVPSLKADTRYDVRLVQPSAGNCTYADLGSFTTGGDS